jgi:hypothetical protein
MTVANRRLFFVGLTAATLVAASSALAHHGWDWAEEKQSQIQATIETISMAPPHPSLTVKTSDGKIWQVDLGNPNQTQRSGFTGETAKPGDAITVLGNRNKDKAKLHMKAVRITLAGKNYDLYPERIQAH